MLKRKLKENENLILWNNKYYVVNDLTYDLLDMFDKKYEVDDIAKKLGFKKKEIKLMFEEIEKKLFAKDYYEDNLKLVTPIKVQWKITNKCNLRCGHCYLGKLDGFELDFDKVMKITDMIIDSNVMEVTLSGGECLTYKGVDKVIFKLLDQGIKVSVFTNAILLKSFLSKLDSKIKDKNNLQFFVSVDGLKENHEKIRGKNTYNKTINNIEYAISKGYKVVTNTVITAVNYDDIIDMVVMLKKLGVKDVQLSNLIVQGNATNDLKLELKKQLELKDKLSELYKKHPEFGYIYYSEIPDEEGVRKVYSLGADKDEYIGNDNWKCTAGIARVTIDPNGKVYCCPFFKDSYLGNLGSEKLEDVWDNVNRYKFLKRLSRENSDRVCLAMKEGSKGDKND